jgi:trimeric autotransporter adhesin
MRALRLLPLSVLSALLLCGTVAIAQEAATAERIVNPIDDNQLVTLKGTVHPLANAKNDRGAAPDAMPLERIHLLLQRSTAQETTLRRLIDDLHTPGTPSYHKWLTPDSFGKQFAPSDKDIAAVQAWLTGHGFTGAKVLPGKQAIEFTGNVGQFRGAFHAQIHKYEVNGETRYANSANPQIPAALAPVVKGFASLNNFRLKSLAQVMGKAQYNPKTDKAIPSWTWGTAANGFDLVVAPGDFAVEYDMTPLYTAGLKGAGQSIAIIDYSNINVDLVNQFRSLFSLPVNPPQVIVDGNDPGIDGINDPEGPAFGTSIESYLDVEWAGAVAPLATIDLIVAADTQLESGGFLAAEHAVYGNVAPVLSSSIYQFGCEQQAGSGNQFIENLWEQAAAQGITVLEAAGDSGSAGCDNSGSAYAEGGLGVNNWASTPFNLAIGGTDFYYTDWATGGQVGVPEYWNTTPNQSPKVSLLKYLPEQPWNNSQFGLDLGSYYNNSGSTTIGGGSGGASNCATGTGETSAGWTTCTAGYPKPAWQTGTGVPNDKVRDIPDVSLFAANGENYSFYPICASDGDCQPATGNNLIQITGVGGTSASAPAFAGIMALINEKYNSRQGQAAYVLYPLKAQFGAAFHDVTVGTNSMPCDLSDGSANCIAAPAGNTISLGGITEGQLGTGSTPDYNATAGYNLATGLGTVDANALVNDWNKVTFATSKTTMTASETSFTHGTAITVSGTVTGTGTPTGDVALMTDSTNQLEQGQDFFTLSGGSYTSGANSIAFLPGGSYNIWARYAGDTKNGVSTSTPIPITVTPQNSSVLFNAIEPSNNGALSSPVPYGQVVTLSAQPYPASDTAFPTCSTNCYTFGVPTGTVTFSDGSTMLNSALVNAEGDAEFTPAATFNAGSHSVTASYSGDSSYNASTASAVTFTVVPSTPTVVIAGTYGCNSYPAGQASTLTVAVESLANGAAPTGTVTITGAPTGTPTNPALSPGVDPSYETTVGLATVTIPANAPVGSYNISATYNPPANGNYTSATTSSAYPVQITSASGITTTMTASASPSSATPNSLVNVTGTVTAASGAAPTGTVYFQFGIIYQGSFQYVYSASVNLVQGSGSSSTFAFTANSSSLIQGANQINIFYYGNGVDAASSALVNIANPLSDFQMVPATTIVPVTAGGSSNVVVNLASTNGFSGAVALTCTGTGVTCTIPSSETLTSGGIGAATVSISATSSTANGTYNVLITGTDPTKQFVHTLGLQAVVTGSSSSSATFALSDSGPISVVAGATTGNTSTVSVTPSNGFTGTVDLTCAVTTIPTGATSPVTCTVPASVDVTTASAITAILTADSTGTTTAGAYVITVTGKSGSITQTTTADVTVTAAVAASYALSNGGNISISPGATTGNTSTISVTPAGGFTGTVALTCAFATNATTDPATCSMSPTSVAITGGALTSSLSITTTASTSSKNEVKKLFWPSAGGATLAFLLFFGLPRRRRNWLAMLGLLAVFAGLAGMGCGGSGGGGGGGGGGGTSAGTYSVTVTGTSGSVTETTTVSVTVQ